MRKKDRQRDLSKRAQLEAFVLTVSHVDLYRLLILLIWRRPLIKIWLQHIQNNYVKRTLKCFEHILSTPWHSMPTAHRLLSPIPSAVPIGSCNHLLNPYFTFQCGCSFLLPVLLMAWTQTRGAFRAFRRNSLLFSVSVPGTTVTTVRQQSKESSSQCLQPEDGVCPL